MISRFRSLFAGVGVRAWAVALAVGLAMVPGFAWATDPVDPDYTLLTTAVWTKVAAAGTLILPALGGIMGVLLVIALTMRLVRRVVKA